MGTYYGTLAAARDLGRAKKSVALADVTPKSHTAQSRYVSSYFLAPDLRSLRTFAEWLISFGKSHPGFILYPTSDDIAWIIAHYHDELKKYFFTFQPKESATYGLLNKEHLTKTAKKLGIPTPESWFPKDFIDLSRISAEVTYPVLVKPKTQIGMTVHVKGIVAHNHDDLLRAFHTYRSRFPYQPEMKEYDPSIEMPMCQEFFQEAARNIYSVSGFISKDGTLSAFRSSVKVLQRPIKIGVGIGFEGRAVDQEVRENILKLAHEVGYFGVFEAEFLIDPVSGKHCLIDFNPRFYGQMAFEISRQLPLAQLVYASALGDMETVQKMIADAQKWDDGVLVKGVMKRPLSLLVTTQWLGGRMSRSTRHSWLKWAEEGVTFDLLHDPLDPRPSRVESEYILRGFLRHPRGSIRAYFG